LSKKLQYSEKLGRKIRQDPVEELGIPTQTMAEQAIREGRIEEGLELYGYMRQEYKIIHDFMVNWVQDLLQYIADNMGEQAVFDAIRVTYEKSWKERYRLWDQMTPEERLQLSVEGMRGHFSGPERRGGMKITEEEYRHVIALDPCGSGGVMRRGDTETGGPPFPTDGVNKEKHDWTWGKTGVKWYCTHCCAATEYLTVKDLGYILRPVDHSMHDEDPCKWYI
jgi:hypothetical protein